MNERAIDIKIRIGSVSHLRKRRADREIFSQLFDGDGSGGGGMHVQGLQGSI